MSDPTNDQVEEKVREQGYEQGYEDCMKEWLGLLRNEASLPYSPEIKLYISELIKTRWHTEVIDG